MDKYLLETSLLDYSSPAIQKVIAEQGWKNLSTKKRISQVYLYVRDRIPFGYNKDDALQASEILLDGYGQCNTKSALLMALLRGVNIPCRFHGFTINKELQKGAITGLWYALAPKEIMHSWVEVEFNGKWYVLEGVITDKEYLVKLQKKFPDCTSTFCGYGVYTDKFQNPDIDWNGNDTYIQKLGINRDFGIFDSPDEFYRTHRQQLSAVKRWVFQNITREIMNRNVERIRKS